MSEGLSDSPGTDGAPGSPMDAEFDTVAWWTAEVVADLGPDHAIPAGCRGSGSPSALAWLADGLHVQPQDRVLDCGAGVGGPGAWLQQRTGVRPVLAEPTAGAVAAARSLFELPVVRADARCLPLASSSFDVAWCLGVLCTLPGDEGKHDLFRELRRVLRPHGRLGMLVLVRDHDGPLVDAPEGNDPPTEAGLAAMLAAARLGVLDRIRTGDAPAASGGDTAGWGRREERVRAALEDRHGRDPAWIAAAENEQRLGRLLADGSVVSWLLLLHPMN